MLTAVKNRLGFVDKKKQPNEAPSFDDYVKRLISVYTSPFAKPKYNYSELTEINKERAVVELDNRFYSDRLIIVRVLLAGLLVGADKDMAQAVQVLSAYCNSDMSRCSELQKSLIMALGCITEFDSSTDYSGLPEAIKAILENPIAAMPTKTSKLPGSNYVPPSPKAALVAAMLDQLIEDGKVPRFFELDHLDDIVPIIESRYAGQSEKYPQRSKAVIRTLAALSAGNPDLPVTALPEQLHVVLTDKHPYLPKRGQLHPTVRNIIPELFDEFTALRANDNPARFLEINKEYSLRQRLKAAQTTSNPWGLAILGGFEQDHNLTFRTVLDLREKKAITEEDEVLVVGPRYPDELTFFRKHLNLPKTIGIDLFDDHENGILARDMHDSGFASGQFGLIYCAGTLNYAYNIRKVVAEFTRILKRPGYLVLTDNADRVNGVDPLGRSDPMNADTLIGLFYKHKINVLAKDEGKTPFPAMFYRWPCVVIEVLE